MPRRRAGIGALKRNQELRKKAAAKGEELEAQHLEHVEEVLTGFKSHLETFARKHRDDINAVRALRALRAWLWRWVC